jgi:hypothetical protein
MAGILPGLRKSAPPEIKRGRNKSDSNHFKLIGALAK